MLYLKLCRTTRTQCRCQSHIQHWRKTFCYPDSRTNVRAQHPGNSRLLNNSRRSEAFLASPLSLGAQPSEVTRSAVACEMLFAFHIRIWFSLLDLMRGAQRYSYVLYDIHVLSCHTPRDGQGLLVYCGRETRHGLPDSTKNSARSLWVSRSNVSMFLSGHVWWLLTYQSFHKGYNSLFTQQL